MTGLLTSDLGSLKDIDSENISRDRGLRALSEASYFTLQRNKLNVVNFQKASFVCNIKMGSFPLNDLC